jgi:hypothetical protein
MSREDSGAFDRDRFAMLLLTSFATRFIIALALLLCAVLAELPFDGEPTKTALAAAVFDFFKS